MSILRRFFRNVAIGTIQIIGFATKDFVEILRQPRLLAALGLGPFLILLLFGVGYRNEFKRFDAVVAVPTIGAFPTDLATYQRELGEVFDVKAVTQNEQEARQMVASRAVEVAIVIDDEAARRLQVGEQASAQVIFNEIDPQRAGWLEHFAEAQTAEMNRRIVVAALEAREPEVRRAREAGQRAEQRLSNPVLLLDPEIAAARNDLRQLNQDLATLDERGAESALTPLGVELENLAQFNPSFLAFYAPGVLALLLQHLTMTMASLSIVRERTLGMMEVFRVAPLTSFRMLLGKSVGFTLVSFVIAIVLAALQLYGLGVPMLGPLSQFALVLGLVLVASLGLGLTISALAKTETQVVQLGALVLLTSVFFSGFALPIEQFLDPVKAVSYLLPVTHGTAALKEVMLRGLDAPYGALAFLAGLAVVLYVVAFLGVRRELRSI